MDQNNSYNLPQEEENSLNIREIFEFIFRLKWWILACAFACLIIGFFYVRMQTPQYERSAWIMMNKNDGTNADMALLSEFTGRTVAKKIDNEVFILQSPSLMARVVDDLDLNTRYYHYAMPIADRIRFARGLFDFKKNEYYLNNPFTMTMAVDSLYPEAMSPSSLSVEFKHSERDSGYIIKELRVNGKKVKLKNTKYAYGEVLGIPGANVTIDLTDPEEMINGDKYVCTWSTPSLVAKAFSARYSAAVQGKNYNQSDVIVLTITDNIPSRAVNILNDIIDRANKEAYAYSNAAVANTIEFIDNRLAALSQELGAAETSYKQYQSSQVLVNLESQSQAAITADQQYQNQLTDVRLQLSILSMISDLVKQDGEYQVIPSNIGIADAGLNSVISNYNSLVTERNRLIASSSASNPRVLSMNTQLEDAKKSISISIDNLVNVYKIRERELRRTISSSQRSMANIPRQQVEVQQLSRKIDIIEPLYLLLQQKREESQITMYSQSDNFRVIESAFGNSTPVKPRPMRIYLLALILGALLPCGVVSLRMLLKTKVETKKDVMDKVDATVIAVLPRAGKDFTGLIPKNGRDTVSESFRMLRSNLQYMPDARVIQVTSSMLGEGKSFISSNLALSISQVGKKVLLIGMDLRKPALPKFFPNVKVEHGKGVVAYLIGKNTDIDAMPVPSGYPNLDIVFSGAVPPNPTELLSQSKEGDIIKHFRGKYDYVIIDSAPYLPVSDSFLINSYVDATLYTIRANYTDLKLLGDINEAINSDSKPMKNVKVVLNDLDVEDKKYRYGYGAGYGYGYGHGYGYGYGYGNEQEHKKMNI